MADKKKDKKEKDKEEEKDEKPAAKEGADGADGDAVAEAPKKKFPLMIVLIVVGVLVLLGSAGAALYFTGVIGGKPKVAAEHKDGETPADAGGEHKSDDAKDEGGDHGKESGGDGGGGGHGGGGGKEGSGFYDLGEIMVNIAGDGRRQTYLRLVVQLELESAKDKEAIENLKPRIIDNFQTYLRELRLDDLRGSAGLYRLREELLFRVTDAVHPIKVKDVLFQQMLVQ